MISSKIFIESDVLIPFIDRNSPNHHKAVNFFNKLAKGNFLTSTSEAVVEETYLFLEGHISKVVAIDFLQAILESNIKILFAISSDVASFFRLVSSSRDKQINFAQGLNAVLMQKNGVIKVATFKFWPNLLGSSVSELVHS